MLNPLNPVLVQTGVLNGTKPVYADISSTVDGGYCGAVTVTLGTSSYQLVPGFLVPPGLVGSATPYRALQSFGPGAVLTLLLPEAQALCAAAQAAGDAGTAINGDL